QRDSVEGTGLLSFHVPLAKRSKSSQGLAVVSMPDTPKAGTGAAPVWAVSVIVGWLLQAESAQRRAAAIPPAIPLLNTAIMAFLVLGRQRYRHVHALAASAG